MANPTVDTRDWNKFINKVLSDSAEPVRAEIITTSREAQKYWRVLEFGSPRGGKPWATPRKKTRVGRDGRIFSRQAPQGFVRKNARNFYLYLREAYLKRLAQLKRPLRRGELADAVNEAGDRALRLLKASVPVDSGELQHSLELREATGARRLSEAAD